jgi:hypothetical protein
MSRIVIMVVTLFANTIIVTRVSKKVKRLREFFEKFPAQPYSRLQSQTAGLEKGGGRPTSRTQGQTPWRSALFQIAAQGLCPSARRDAGAGGKITGFLIWTARSCECSALFIEKQQIKIHRELLSY